MEESILRMMCAGDDLALLAYRDAVLDRGDTNLAQAIVELDPRNDRGFSDGDGYGNGNGDGYGDGYGYADGYGDGYGYADGYADGYGDGYGYADGDGNGYG